QKGRGGWRGWGRGRGSVSAGGSANLLTRTTAVLAVCFFASSLLLSWLASFERKPASIIGTQAPSQTQPAGGTPVTPPTSGGLLDTLKKADEQQQQAPATPQAPRSQ